MNERLKELAKQSGARFGEASKDYFGDVSPAFVSTRDLDIEKFAELIIKECAEIYSINAQPKRPLFPTEFSTALRTHFGVK